MKKGLLKVVTCMLALVMCLTVTAMAAPAIEGEPVAADGAYSTTVTITDVGSSDQVSLLVVKAGKDLSNLVASDVLYIDQAAADSEGDVTFTFVTTTNAIDVYSGYSTMALTDSPLSIIYDGVIPADAPTIDETASVLYPTEAPFGLEGYRRIFIKLSEDENGAWTPEHSDADSEIYYSTEIEGYDGLIKSNAADLAAALAEISWTNVAPSTDATIAKYGDVSGDGEVKANDMSMIKAAVAEKVTFDIKKSLTADVNADSGVKANDMSMVKAFVAEKLTAFTGVTNRQ